MSAGPYRTPPPPVEPTRLPKPWGPWVLSAGCLGVVLWLLGRMAWQLLRVAEISIHPQTLALVIPYILGVVGAIAGGKMVLERFDRLEHRIYLLQHRVTDLTEKTRHL